jgi:serine/threonine-protein kinase
LELKRAGYPVRLQESPARLLNALLQNPGQLVTREQLRTELWPENTFVQFDAGLNTAMNKLRLALRDAADNPTFIETVPRTGYRFIAPVERLEARLVPIAEKVTVMPVAVPAPAPEVEPATPAPVPVSGSRWRWWFTGFCAILLISAIAIVIVARGPSRNSSQPTVRFAIDLPAGQEFQYYGGRQIAISPDGQTIAWIAVSNNVRQIYARRLDGTDYWPLAGTERANGLGFSPDGDWLVYLAGGGQLRKASVDGRWNTKVLDLPGSWDATMVWAPDGWIYFSAGNFRASGLTRKMFRVRSTGGDPEAVLPDPQPPSAVYPLEWLRSGILFTTDYTPSDLAVDLWAPAEHKKYQLLRYASGGRYLPTGHLVFDRSGNLMAVPFDLDRKEVRGKEVVVVPDVAPDRWAGLQMDVSETGTMVFFRGVNVHEREPVWVDQEGHESPASFPAGRYHLLDISAQGDLLLARYDSGDHFTTYSMRSGKSSWKEVLSGETPNTSAIWNPKGDSVAVGAAFQGERMGTIYVKPLDGAAAPRPLLGSSYTGKFPQSWSRPANAIVYADGYSETTKRDIYVLPLDTGAQPRCIACGPANEILPSFSPDGRWIAYTSDESKTDEIYVQRYPGPPAPIRVSREGGRNSLWAPSGREIYYWQGDAVWAVGFDASTGQPGKPRRLFSGKYEHSSNWNRDWLISPDGTRFLLLKAKDEPADYRRIQVVVNWFEELRKTVASGQ